MYGGILVLLYNSVLGLIGGVLLTDMSSAVKSSGRSSVHEDFIGFSRLYSLNVLTLSLSLFRFLRRSAIRLYHEKYLYHLNRHYHKFIFVNVCRKGARTFFKLFRLFLFNVLFVLFSFEFCPVFFFSSKHLLFSSSFSFHSLQASSS